MSSIIRYVIFTYFKLEIFQRFFLQNDNTKMNSLAQPMSKIAPKVRLLKIKMDSTLSKQVYMRNLFSSLECVASPSKVLLYNNGGSNG